MKIIEQKIESRNYRLKQQELTLKKEDASKLRHPLKYVGILFAKTTKSKHI
jgi:hypothetical protein